MWMECFSRSQLRIVRCLEHHQLQVVRYLVIKLIFFALQGNDTFQFEEDCLEHVLDSMEQELVKTRTQLCIAEEEVMSLRLRLSE